MEDEDRGASFVKWGFAAVVLALIVFVLLDAFEGPFYSFSTKTWPPEVRGTKLVGGIEGAVKTADTETSTVHVASGFLGFGSLPVVVTPETKIAVKGKLGALGDIDRGQHVRIAYEVLPDRLVAWRVEVLDGYALPSEALIPAETESDTAVTEQAAPKAAAPTPVAAPVPAPVPDPPRASTPVAPTRVVAPSPTPKSTPLPTAAATKRPVPSSSPRTTSPDARRSEPAPPPASTLNEAL